MVEEETTKFVVSSDEFGDDFDSEMVEALDISPPHEVVQAPLATSYITIPTESVHPPLPVQSPETIHSKQEESDDEFGIEDEDDFAADLEQVASLYDTRALESPTDNEALIEETDNGVAAGNAASAIVIDLLEDDSDEFGEDIDVDEFAAAEVAATQAPANTVRRT